MVAADIRLTCKNLIRGKNVVIGDEEAHFRFPGGVRIDVGTLILGDNVEIGRQVEIKGPYVELGNNVKIGSNVVIDVRERLEVGADSTIQHNCEIRGRMVKIGQRFRMLDYARIGGGSCFESLSSFQCGDDCHLGLRGFINTARPVLLGDEVGLGTDTKIYTHGAYASVLDGKPVQWGPVTIGDRCWLPGATVLPGITIERDSVIGAGSVVTRDVSARTLVAGSPAKKVRDLVPLSPLEKTATIEQLLRDFTKVTGYHAPQDFTIRDATIGVPVRDTETVIDLSAKTIRGERSDLVDQLLTHLRRYGIRIRRV